MNDNESKSQKIAFEFPQFTFPQIPGNESLSYGEFHGLGPSPVFEAHLSQGRPFERVGPSLKIHPKTRILEERIHNRDIGIRQNEMMDYYQTNHMDALGPKNIIESYLANDLNDEIQLKKYDPYLGNGLYACARPGLPPAVLYATGPLLSKLGVSVGFSGSENTVAPLEFQTPIRQITGQYSHSNELVAVRTWDGVSFLDVHQDEDESLAYVHTVNTHRFARPPLDVALHPELHGQSLILLQGGAICLWDVQNPSSSRIKVIYESTEELVRDIADEWKACVFGSHPRQAFVAHPKRLDMLDLRTSQLSTLLNLDDHTSIRFYSMARHPTNPFHLALSASKSIDIYDTRYTRRSVFNFAFQDHRDHYSELAFLPSEDETFLVSWNKVRGDVVAFTYDPTQKIDESLAPLPPALTCVQYLSPSKSSLLITDKSQHHGTFVHPKQDHHNTLKEEEEFPNWPRLVGVAPVRIGCDGLTMHYLFEDGAMYKTKFKKRGSNDPTNREDVEMVRMREEIILEKEQTLADEESKIPDLIHDHVLFNARRLINDINEEIRANVNAMESTRDLSSLQETVTQTFESLQELKYHQSMYEIYFRDTYKPLEQDPTTGRALHSSWLQCSNVLDPEFSSNLEAALNQDLSEDRQSNFIDICPPCLMPSVSQIGQQEESTPLSRFSSQWVSRQLELSSHVILPSLPRIEEHEMDTFEREIPGLDSGALTIDFPLALNPLELPAICGAYRNRWLNPKRFYADFRGLDAFPMVDDDADPNEHSPDPLASRLPAQTPVRIPVQVAPPTIQSASQRPQSATPLPSSQIRFGSQTTPSVMGVISSSQLSSSQRSSQSKGKGKSRRKGF